MRELNEMLKGGLRVRCHLNLHRGDWSITYKGKVIAHVDQITLADCRMIVRENARLRVIANRCREVHAWIEGNYVEEKPQGDLIPITYNPYAAGTFTRRDNGTAVTTARFVFFTHNKQANQIL